MFFLIQFCLLDTCIRNFRITFLDYFKTKQNVVLGKMFFFLIRHIEKYKLSFLKSFLSKVSEIFLEARFELDKVEKYWFEYHNTSTVKPRDSYSEF